MEGIFLHTQSMYCQKTFMNYYYNDGKNYQLNYKKK